MDNELTMEEAFRILEDLITWSLNPNRLSEAADASRALAKAAFNASFMCSGADDVEDMYLRIEELGKRGS